MRKNFNYRAAVLAVGLLFGKLNAQIPFEVVDYSPAPGQFVDYTQFLEEGQQVADLTQAGICAWLNAQMEDLPFGYAVSLGAFGGSITVRLKSPLSNKAGTDFKVYGNAFYEGVHTPAMSGRPGGSAEPGIVWVSRDVNGNGLPDDPWYEIAGSAFNDSATLHDYSVTYYLPDSLAGDIPWRDNRGGAGFITRNTFHTQPTYYPLWSGGDSLCYKGTRLADNAEWVTDEDGGGKWILFCYDWGYADNHPNISDKSDIDIDWAVDAEGNPVVLESIDFVKVVSALHQQLGPIGESSTEFSGIAPLHAADNGFIPTSPGFLHARPNPCTSHVQVFFSGDETIAAAPLELLDRTGRILQSIPVRGATTLDLSAYPAGLYLLRVGENTLKIIHR